MESSLLLQTEDLESVKVGQFGALGLLLLPLGPVGLLPFLVDLGLLPELLDGGGPRAAGQGGQNEVGQNDLGERNGLAGDSQGRVGSGTVNQSLFRTDLVNRAVHVSRLLAFEIRVSVSFSSSGTYAFVVNDLDNGSQTAGRRTLLDQDDTADLDEAPVGSDDADVTHFRRWSLCDRRACD